MYLWNLLFISSKLPGMTATGLKASGPSPTPLRLHLLAFHLEQQWRPKA